MNTSLRSIVPRQKSEILLLLELHFLISFTEMKGDPDKKKMFSEANLLSALKKM